jgi:hypothetical protein
MPLYMYVDMDIYLSQQVLLAGVTLSLWAVNCNPGIYIHVNKNICLRIHVIIYMYIYTTSLIGWCNTTFMGCKF